MPEKPVVIVTGASKGIGREIARRLGQAGAAVAAAARSAEALESVCAWIRDNGSQALSIPLDVSIRSRCQEAVQLTVETFGRIDALVNNAGVLEPVAFLADADPDTWRSNVEINLLGPFFLMQAALPHLRNTKGRIVNISTGAAEKPMEGWSAYCAAKAGLAHLTRVVAAEEPHITSVSLRPGVVDTEMQDLIRQKGAKGMAPERAAYFQNLKEEGRLVPPAVPARAAAWLALHAPADWSGKVVEYDDPQIEKGARKMFPAA